MQEMKTITLVEPQQTPEVYANHVTPSISSFDVTLHFGSVIEVVGTEAKIARRVSIVMSPEIAKLLGMQLTMGLAAYEKNVRPIHVPAKLARRPPA